MAEKCKCDLCLWNQAASGGGGSGGGSLLVTLTMTENQEEKGGAKAVGTDTYTITADKTAGEIQTALKTGICVIYTFADSVDDREYTGCMGPVVYTHDGYHDGYYVYLPNCPVEGLFAATANDYPIDDRYAP